MLAMALPDGDSKLAHQLVERGALLLDVRTEAEFKEQSLPNSLLIPHDQVGTRIAEIVAAVGGDKHKPIVVFCRRGGRAATAKQVLLANGFTEVSNLGGIGDW
ncbi:rhodanese-like domain-containing protein [Nannocystaceae bacterium ST9]